MIRYPNFSWWQGIVEDRHDPEQFGRYRVRIIGYHTLDKAILPTESLPWAIPMQPVTSAAISGVGSSPTGLVEGSSVIGFFVDGEDSQIPVIMGCFGVEDNVPAPDGIPETPEALAQRGFFDPTGTYPRRKELKKSEDEGLLDKVKGLVEDGVGGVLDELGNKLTGDAEGVDEVDVGKNVLGEASSSRLARGGDTSENHYSLKGKRDSRITKIPRGYASKISGWTNIEIPFEHDNDGEKIPVKAGTYEPTYWDEPHPQGVEKSESKYPYNHVRETESGHVFEVDDTPGAERIHEYHTAGSFREVQADGTKVEKIVGDDYVIDLKNKSMYVGGNFDLMVEGDYNINVKGNKYEHVSGHSYNVIKGNRLNKIQGHELIDTESTYHMMVGGNFNCQVGVTDKDKKSMGNYRLRVTNQMNQTIQGKHKIFGGQDFKHVVKGDFHVNTTLRTGPDPDALLDLAKGGSVGADAFVSGGSIKLEAIKKIDLNTFVTKLPKVPGSPVGSQISLVSDRINQTAQVDMVERIGPVAPPSFVQMIGNKKTFVMNPTGVGGIQNYLAGAGVIENNITGIGAINNFVVGAGFINNAIAGAGTISNVTGAALPGTFGTPAAVLAGTTTQIMTNASILTVTPTVGITAITNILGATTVTGVGLVNGALTVTGLVTGGTTILQTHVHSVGGSAAPSTGTPI
tara:strand:- start:7236 stop:9290 length:2055 start_codon:yes stop_codon:yes gene_type:complete